MANYWLLDRHGAEGPSALVKTDGSMHVIEVLRFGPGVTELEDQQKIWDEVIGRVAPTLKPLVAARKLAERGVDLHVDLNTGGSGRSAEGGRAHSSNDGASAGRAAGSARRTGGRGRG